MGKQRNITPQVAKSYDDAFEAFNEVVKKGKGNTGFGSLGSAAASTFRGYDTGIGDSKYDKGLSWNANIDEDNVKGSINEFRSEQQGGWAETGAFFGRVTNKVGLELAKTAAAIVGTVGGLAGNTSDLITGNDEYDFLEIAFNNDFIKAAEKISKSINEEYLPVYVSDTVANGNFLDKISSGEFWATEGADGVGYLISAMAPGAAFKVLGGSGKIFGGVTQTAKFLNYGEGLEGARKMLTAAGLTIDKIDSYAIPALNTYFEAGAEAKGVGDNLDARKFEFVDNFKNTLNVNSQEFQNKVLDKLQQLDIDRRNNVISIDEYNQLSQNAETLVADELAESAFKEQKGRAMRNAFLTNVGILAIPNYIQAKLVFGKNPSNILLDKVVDGVANKTAKNTFKQGLKRTGQAFLSEGSEEVAQTSTEKRNVDKALKGKLGEYATDDFDPFTFGTDFVKSLGTTEGQIAGFLGGVLGSPISIVQGYKQDLRDRKETERLRDKINGQSTALKDIYNTPLYETEEYTNPETGEKGIRDKEVDGKKVFIPENVAKVKEALDFQEALSKRYDQAVEEGDVETLDYLKKQGEFNIIANFIGEDVVTLDALNEHLNTIFPTIEQNQDGSAITPEQVKQNTENKQRISNVIDKAKVLQKDLVSFKDMSTSIIKLNNPKATKEQVADFLNNVGYAFISERSEEYDLKQKYKELKLKQKELQKDQPIDISENTDFIEGKTEDIYRERKIINNPRLDLVNKQIEEVENKLNDFTETTNSTIWDNEFLNKQFDNRIKAEEKIKANNTPEVIAKADEANNIIDNATTKEELDNLPKTNTDTDKVIKAKAETKKAELDAIEESNNAEERAGAIQEDQDFSNETKYDSLTSTEGSIVTDELIPTEGENNSSEELKTIKTGDVDNGKGVKVISTNRETGEVFSFITEQFPLYLEYEREPVNKSGKEVGFEINQNPGSNPKVLEALKAFNNKDFSNPKLLFDYLPINVQFTNEVKAPIETRRANDEIDPSTEILRTEIINNLINGVDISNIKTTIQDQYKGVLKVESDTAENNILQLNGVKDLAYIRENLYVVNSQGQLQNILKGITSNFKNDKIKPNAAGEIYLMIPQANGKPFPLKLNIKKINISEAGLLLNMYLEILNGEKSLDTTLSEIDSNLKDTILNKFQAELAVIGGNKNDIKLQEIIDLLIYQSDNIKSQMRIENNVLYYGDKTVTAETFNNEIGQEITNFLVNQKRHQIKISPKSETDNTRTNLKSNSANYLKYLVDNNILSTNAVVNEPTFQGYTNIYLNTGITVNNQTQSKVLNKSAEKLVITEQDREGASELLEILNQKGLKVKLNSITGLSLENATRAYEILNSLGKAELIGKVVKYYYGNISPNEYNKKLGQNLSGGEFPIDMLKNALKNIENSQPKISESGVEVSSNNVENNLNYLNEPTISEIDDGKLYEFKTEDGIVAGVMISPTEFRIDGINANEVGKGQGTKMFEALIEYLRDKGVTTLSTKSAGKGAIQMHNKAIDKGLLEKIQEDGRNAIFKINKTQPKVSEQGVEVKTEGTGFDSLFGNTPTVTQPVTGTSISYTPTGKQTQTYTIDKTKILNSKGEEVFKEDSADRRKIFANLAIKEGRAKVIEDNKGIKYVVNNKQQIMSTTTGKIMAWAENHATRKLLIDKYNSLTEPKVSDAGVQVTTTNTGFEDLFENKPNNIRNSQEQLILSTVKDNFNNTPLLKNDTAEFEFGITRYIPRILLEKAYENDKGNNSKLGGAGQTLQRIIERGGYSINEMDRLYPNWRKELISLNKIRNSQKNSVSLSEIPGTIENKQLVETQSEVFEAKKGREKAQEIRRMSILFRKQSEGTLTKENEIRDFENFKKAYPEEYKKTCK